MDRRAGGLIILFKVSQGEALCASLKGGTEQSLCGGKRPQKGRTSQENMKGEPCAFGSIG